MYQLIREISIMNNKLKMIVDSKIVFLLFGGSIWSYLQGVNLS